MSSVKSFVTIAALILGGFWTYFKFIKDRVYRPRLDISIDAGTVSIDGKKNLLWDLSVKNIGTSKVTLVHQGMGLRVTEGEPATKLFRDPRWGGYRTFPVFEKHQWIESGETIREQMLAALPQEGERALKLEARIVVKRRKRNVSIYSPAVVPSSVQWKGTDTTKEADDGKA